jgi:23S rRNA (cytosine1962-C5)-methyltransferase
MDLEITAFEGWELLDSGDERKLERMGSVVLDRPCPQAIWPPRDPALWKKAHASFARKESGQGDWTVERGAPESWKALWGKIRFELRLTGFGNVGLFPEHAAHWTWMQELLAARPKARVLNLFGYTGGASMACAQAGADVTHVDAARSVNGWAQTNAELSQPLAGTVRYLAEDAAKFVKREARRESLYDGIILDPPTFGRGAKGEVWKIERDLWPLLDACAEILSKKPLFTLLTAHSPGVTPRVLEIAAARLGAPRQIDFGEMLLKGAGPAVPAGAYARAEY